MFHNKYVYSFVMKVMEEKTYFKMCETKNMTSSPVNVWWGKLPVVVLRNIYKYLRLTDVLAASQTCRNWRLALYSFDARRRNLALEVSSFSYDENLFLMGLFSKYLEHLTLYLDCDSAELEVFTDNIMCRLHESKHLLDLTVISRAKFLFFEPTMLPELWQNQFSDHLLQCLGTQLRTLHLHGCGFLLPRHLQGNITKEWRDKFSKLRCIAATSIHVNNIGPICNPVPAPFTLMQSLCMDYHLVDPNVLQTFSALRRLRHIALNLTQFPCHTSPAMRPAWAHMISCLPSTLEVTINCINLTPEELSHVKDLVLFPEIPLAVFRVLFCKTLNLDVIHHLNQYVQTLREVHYVDSHRRFPPNSQIVRYVPPSWGSRAYMVNPFVMLCWKCAKMSGISLHGYWLSAHDLLGMARLRGSKLEHLSVSALIPDSPDPDQTPVDSPALYTPVIHQEWTDELFLSDEFIDDVCRNVCFQWFPEDLDRLHPALCANPHPGSVWEYILNITQPDLKFNSVDDQP